MSEQVARTLTNPSNRIKSAERSERRVVYKSVLDNPYCIPWPPIPLNVQNSFLAQVVTLLDGITAYHAFKSLNSRKRKKVQAQTIQSGDVPTQPADFDVSKQIASSDAANSDIMDPPSILGHLTVGINQVGAKLDTQIKSWRSTRVNSTKNQEPAATNSSQPIAIVFVCRADVNPPILIAHIPPLVAAYNTTILSRPSLKNIDLIRLVPLPKGAEFTLAEALGIRRAAVLALDSTTPGLASLSSLLESVPILSAQWLAPPDPSRPKSFIPTHIKQLKTSAPKDMKAAKEKRAASRAAAKERRRERRKRYLDS